MTYGTFRAIRDIRRNDERSDFGFGVCTVEGNPADHWRSRMLIPATVNGDATFRYEISTALDCQGIGRVRQGENAVSTHGRYGLCRLLHRDDGACLEDRGRNRLAPANLSGWFQRRFCCQPLHRILCDLYDDTRKVWWFTCAERAGIEISHRTTIVAIRRDETD